MTDKKIEMEKKEGELRNDIDLAQEIIKEIVDTLQKKDYKKPTAVILSLEILKKSMIKQTYKNTQETEESFRNIVDILDETGIIEFEGTKNDKGEIK